MHESTLQGPAPRRAPVAVDVMQLSVVIPARNARATLDAQLDALLGQQADCTWEVVVVDNGSDDGTPALVEEYTRRDPRVRLVRADDASGPSHARNVGAQHARGTHLACCDADDVVAGGLVAAMADALQQHRFVGGAIELDHLNPPWLAAGRGRSLEGGLMHFAGVAFAHGCNLGIERSLLLERPFDERLRAGEEIDLALRLHALGIDCTFVPSAVVHYRYRRSLRATMRQAYVGGLVAPTLRAAFPGAPRARHARRAAWLAGHLLALTDRSGRIRWTWIAGEEAGQLVGAWRLRRTPRPRRGR